MMILVTGGAGYLGSTVVRTMLRSGFAVRVVDTLRYGGLSILGLLDHPRFEFIHGDVRDRECMTRAFEGVSTVVHLAAVVGELACSNSVEEASQVNLEATKDLWALSKMFNVQRFVFSSTCSNYGYQPETRLDEDSPLLPRGYYASSKVAAEKHILDTASAATQAVLLRFSTLYGLSPRMRFDLTVNHFTLALHKDRDLEVFDGDTWRPYLHVLDASRAIKSVIQAELDSGPHVFNVGSSSENYRKTDIAGRVCDRIPEGRVTHVSNAISDARSYRVDFSRIASRIGFQTHVALPRGIAEIHDALLQGVFPLVDSAMYSNW